MAGTRRRPRSPAPFASNTAKSRMIPAWAAIPRKFWSSRPFARVRVIATARRNHDPRARRPRDPRQGVAHRISFARVARNDGGLRAHRDGPLQLHVQPDVFGIAPLWPRSPVAGVLVRRLAHAAIVFSARADERHTGRAATRA